MTFKKLKIKLWLQENKKILWLLELIFTIILVFLFGNKIRSVYKELHADHETGAADNK